MKFVFSPESFHLIALSFHHIRWKLLTWSLFTFALFMLLQAQVTNTTPNSLVWFALFILFSALQLLVFSAFIFFFQKLTSSTNNNNFQWLKFYRIIEWCEAILFFFLLPLPSLVFIYALLTVQG